MPRRPIPSATSPNTEEDKIILSIDIGTTQSAVAVYYNKPGRDIGLSRETH
jgi:molecular chaperone DnaK (HSP70)